MFSVFERCSYPAENPTQAECGCTGELPGSSIVSMSCAVVCVKKNFAEKEQNVP